MAVERAQNKSQHTKLTLETKIVLPLLPGFELAAFRSRVRRSTNTLSLGTWDLYLSVKHIAQYIDTIHKFALAASDRS